MRPRKYDYLKIIQGDYGCGWEDLDAYDMLQPGWFSKFLKNYNAYRQEESQYPHRAIERRVLRVEQ